MCRQVAFLGSSELIRHDFNGGVRSYCLGICIVSFVAAVNSQSLAALSFSIVSYLRCLLCCATPV